MEDEDFSYSDLDIDFQRTDMLFDYDASYFDEIGEAYDQTDNRSISKLTLDLTTPFSGSVYIRNSMAFIAVSVVGIIIV